MLNTSPKASPEVPASKNIEKPLEEDLKEEIKTSTSIRSLINKLSKVKNIKSNEGKDIDTADIVVLLEDLMTTNEIVDLQNKMEQYEKYITGNYGLRDKVKQLVESIVESKLSRIKPKQD